MSNILILDDEPQWRLFLLTLLKAREDNIFEADCLEIAKQLLSESYIDLVILDLNLSDASLYDLSGLEILYIIEKYYINIKVIILTGYDNVITNNLNKTLNVKVLTKFNFDNQYFIQTINDLLKTK